MDKSLIKEKIIVIVSNILDNNTLTITEKTKSDDIPEWDSLRHVMILDEIQKEFKIEFEILEIIELYSISDIIDLIETKLAN